MAWANSDGKRGFFTTEKLRHMARLFWGGEKAVEFDSPDAMGAAAVHIQNRAYAKESLVACDWFWPINFSGNAESGTGDPALEARLLSAVTGEETGEGEYMRIGARCFNQNRAIYLREGRRGRRDDVLEERFHDRPFQHASNIVSAVNPDFRMPGSEGKLISCQGARVDRGVFRRIMDDYYRARGWDVETGLLRKEGLENLGLTDLIPELEKSNLVS
jgi:aldehyde:ferredoxin oxidoreductase